MFATGHHTSTASRSERRWSSLSRPVFALDEIVLSNRIQQVVIPADRQEGRLATFTHNRTRGFMVQPRGGENTLVVSSHHHPPAGYSRAVRTAIDPQPAEVDLSASRWLRHPSITGAAFDHAAAIESTLASWRGACKLGAGRRDSRARRSSAAPDRRRAFGAAHWAVSDRAATVVMPTGTSKTETMLSVLVAAVCRKVLVVVPSDALRAQLAEKFFTLEEFSPTPALGF